MDAALTNDATPATDSAAKTSSRPTRRDDLIRVAREEFSRHGFVGASVVSIATRGGIRKSSLFHHFATKDELYDAAVQQLVSEVVSALDVAAADVRGFAARLEAATAKLHSALLGDPAAARLLLRVLLDADAHESHSRSLLAAVIDSLAAVVRCGIDEGALPAQDPRQAACTLLGVICFPFATLEQSERGAAYDSKLVRALSPQLARLLLAP